MSEKNIFKASDEQWERFIRAWAKDIRSKKGLPAIKASLTLSGTTPVVVQNAVKSPAAASLALSGATATPTVVQNVHAVSVIRVAGFFLDWLLLPSLASDARLSLEDTYDQQWLPKYGPFLARFIFISQAAGTIWKVRGHGLTKWLFGALLLKLYEWFSGPRGG
jgi:hypothetical protein